MKEKKKDTVELLLDVMSNWIDAEIKAAKLEQKLENRKIEIPFNELEFEFFIPKKMTPLGSEWFNDYINGWNDCIDELKRLNGM